MELGLTDALFCAIFSSPQGYQFYINLSFPTRPRVYVIDTIIKTVIAFRIQWQLIKIDYYWNIGTK